MKYLLIILTIALVACGNTPHPSLPAYDLPERYHEGVTAFLNAPEYGKLTRVGGSITDACSQRVPELFTGLSVRAIHGMNGAIFYNLWNDVLKYEGITKLEIQPGHGNTFPNNFDTMLIYFNQALRNIHDIPVYVRSVSVTRDPERNKNISAFNKELKNIVSTYPHVHWIDVNPVLTDPEGLLWEEYALDLVHFTDAGCLAYFTQGGM